MHHELEPFGPHWRAVTSEVFYAAMRLTDVHPRVRGRYSDANYGSDWINQKTGAVVGKLLQVGPHPATKPNALYFLPCARF